jgi:hypothetical protein
MNAFIVKLIAGAVLGAGAIVALYYFAAGSC